MKTMIDRGRTCVAGLKNWRSVALRANSEEGQGLHREVLSMLMMITTATRSVSYPIFPDD